MSNRKDQARYALFTHYFLLYAIAIAYFAFASCNGVRKGLIPERNAILGELPIESQNKCMELFKMNNDDGKVKIEKEISNIRTKDALINFINKSLQNHIIYNRLLQLLPKPERLAWQQKFAKTPDLDDQARLIAQNEMLLQKIQHVSMQHQQHYIDLLEIVSDEEAVALKNKILQSTKAEEIERLIASKLPKEFNALSDEAKEKLSHLPDHERQEIIKATMRKNGTKDDSAIQSSTTMNHHQATALPNHQDDLAAEKAQPSEMQLNNTPTDPNTSNDGHAATSSSEPDINTLIEQKIQAQQNKDEAMPQDDWGPKLSLAGEERKQFLTCIMQFSQLDQKSLKELFDKANPNSIDNFLSVYYTGFNTDERTELLATMIYLYKGWPERTIRLCNTPTALSWYDKISLFQQTTKKQLNLLTKLDNLLQAL